MDPFKNYAHAPISAATEAISAVPSDSALFDVLPRAIYVGTAGDVVAVVKGVEVTFKNHPVGWLPVRAEAIKNTGTTAADFVLVW